MAHRLSRKMWYTLKAPTKTPKKMRLTVQLKENPSKRRSK